MFRFKCKHIPFVLHSHTLSQVLSLPVRIYGIYPPISGIWEKPSHIPESSPEPHFPGSGLRMGLGSSVCAWQLNNLWCRPCHRLYLSVPPSRIHTHTPTHSHAQTHLQSSRTHTIRLLWRSVSHYGLLGLLHYAACLHSHLLIRSTYTHGCGGVSSKSVNIAASWLPVWPTERTRKKQRRRSGNNINISTARQIEPDQHKRHSSFLVHFSEAATAMRTTRTSTAEIG